MLLFWTGVAIGVVLTLIVMEHYTRPPQDFLGEAELRPSLDPNVMSLFERVNEEDVG